MSYQEYLNKIGGKFQKVVKLEFLQPDDSVAFTLDNNSNKGKAFIKDGSVDINLQNGQRRKATITLANLDNAFDYNVNNVWFGQRLRLSMGIKLKDGTDFLLPQGVFYIQNPQYLLNHNTNTATFNLVDKWAYLDGTLFGNLEATYQIKAYEDKSPDPINKVPISYDVYDYINGSSGKAYIKTDFIPEKTSLIKEAEFVLTKSLPTPNADSQAYDYFILSADENFWFKTMRYYIGSPISDNNYQHRYRRYYSSDGRSYLTFMTDDPNKTPITINTKCSFTNTKSSDNVKAILKIGGTDYEGKSYYDNTQHTIIKDGLSANINPNKKELYIGRSNQYSELGEKIEIAPMLFYGLKIIDTDTNKTVLDLVPAKNKTSKRVGLYDVVSQKFYASATDTGFTVKTHGTFPNSPKPRNLVYTNIFSAIQSLLNMSKYDYSSNADGINKIDITPPSFTTYYNDKTYVNADGTAYPVTNVPFDISSDSTIADLILQLNDSIVGLIGYDQSGSLRIEPAQAYIKDYDKPILWYFDLSKPNLCEISETFENEDVKNDIKIIGEGLDEIEIYGRARNFDGRSDTNINIIGDKVLKDESSTFWNTQQCIDQACYQLKKQTALKKSISIQTTQMFHLYENGVIAIKRTDKKGSPIEKHIIQSISLPISEQGTMTINAVSINDVDIEITTSSSEDK